jgi:uncharacterized membrane protein
MAIQASSTLLMQQILTRGPLVGSIYSLFLLKTLTFLSKRQNFSQP